MFFEKIEFERFENAFTIYISYDTEHGTEENFNVILEEVYLEKEILKIRKFEILKRFRENLPERYRLSFGRRWHNLFGTKR